MIKLNPKEILLKDLLKNIAYIYAYKATLAKKISHFRKYGNVSLLFEIMNLRKKILKIKEQMQTVKKIVESSQ